MPYTLNVNAYPLQLYSLVENVLLTQEKAVVELGSRKAANKLRKQLYGLKNALLASKEHPLNDKAIKITTEQYDNIIHILHVDANVDPGLIKAAKQLEED